MPLTCLGLLMSVSASCQSQQMLKLNCDALLHDGMIRARRFSTAAIQTMFKAPVVLQSQILLLPLWAGAVQCKPH